VAATLAFLLSHAGVSVAAIAGLIAINLFAAGTARIAGTFGATQLVASTAI
jgi:hypothetical protein